MPRKPKVEAASPTAITVMQHRGTMEVTSCPLCTSEPGEECTVNGISGPAVHELRFLALPLKSPIRRGGGVYGPDKGKLVPFAAGALEASLMREERGNVASEAKSDLCTCGSSSFMTTWLAADGTKIADPGDLSSATHELRRCLGCGGAKGEATPIAGAVAPDPTEWCEELVDVSDLVFDPAFQIRTVKVNPDTVDDYAEKMLAGVVFPKIRIVRIDGVPHVVDGWQRGHAARKANVPRLLADVRVGTRRDAKAIAIGVNADHGLQRTVADKRAAVIELLMDHEWCALSGRELAEMAHVSHEHVNKLRRHYSALVGIPLTEDRIADADGVLPARYEALAKGTDWLRNFAGKVRAARNLRALGALLGDAYGPALSMIELRLVDLAATDWPWPVDVTLSQMQARAKTLDTTEQLERALAAHECPGRIDLLKVWQRAKSIGRLDRWSLDSARDLFKGRPALLKLVDARREDLKRKKEAEEEQEPTTVAKRLLNGGEDELVSGVNEADPGLARALLAFQRSLPEAAFHVLVNRLSMLDMRPRRCPDPACASVALEQAPCPICREWADGAKRAVSRSVAHAARLAAAGVPIPVGDVVVDGAALEVLGQLRGLVAQDPDAVADWVGALRHDGPRHALAGWLFRAKPEPVDVDQGDEDVDQGDQDEDVDRGDEDEDEGAA